MNLLKNSVLTIIFFSGLNIFTRGIVVHAEWLAIIGTIVLAVWIGYVQIRIN